MATVADLGINIVADTRGMGPPIDQARAKLAELGNEADKFGGKAGHAFQGPIGGLRQLSEQLHSGMKSMRDFNAVLELGFGMRIGRMIFEKIHEGFVHFVEGANEASHAGLSLGDAYLDGAKKILGMKTAVEELNEKLKEQ